jgi:serine/threonine protein kinase
MADSDKVDRPSSAEEAFAVLIQLQESGEGVDFETWVCGYPQFETELREFYAEWMRIKPQLEQALAGPAGPDSPQITDPDSGAAATLELPQPKPGTRIGDFLLVRLIAQGGMGQVWEAFQRSMGRVVALKLIRSDRIDERTLVLFEREARAGGRVNDPRIVTVYGTGESDGVRWIAEEYVTGEKTLAQVLARDRKGPARRAADFERWARFFADVAEAMHAVHEVGVVHRDLKPGNILIARDGNPKITDFGLARVIDEASLSGPLSLAGTVHYMSPEQADGFSGVVDRRSDVFSLGVVLYEALARQRPFEGSSGPEILIQITRVEPPDPRSLAPEIPKELAWIALKALEKQPQRRYASMADFAADLRRFLADEPITAHELGRMERATKWARRHPTTSVACSLIAVLALAVWGFTSHSSEQREQLIESQKRELINQINFCIDNGDVRGAEEKATALGELDPYDPMPELLRGNALASVGHVTAAQEVLQAARAKLQDHRFLKAAEDPYRRALLLMASGDREEREKAEGILSDLVEADPKAYHAWFSLYQTRKFLRDNEGAARALDVFRNSLRLGDIDRIQWIDGLRSELRGNYGDAIQAFEALCASAEPSLLLEMRIHRHLGRNYLFAYQKSDRSSSEGLDAAEEHLSLMLQDLPDDSDALAGLGYVAFLRADLLNPGDLGHGAAIELLCAQCDRFAKEALAHFPDHLMASEVLVGSALLRAGNHFEARSPNEAVLADLKQRVDGLERLDANSDPAKIGRSMLLYYRGAIAEARGQIGDAVALFEESIDTDETQLRSRIVLGGRLFIDQKDYVNALSLFEEASQIWNDGPPNTWEPRWRFAIDVWLFGTADLAKAPKLAREARDRALAWYAADNQVYDEDLLNLAEFLATAEHRELADCELAWKIIDQHKLEQSLGGRPGAKETFDHIAKSCPRDNALPK